MIEDLQTLGYRPQRIVSLVPSLTETFFDLGLGRQLAAVTDYCTRPEGLTQSLPKVGGPKTPRLEDILRHRPDLVAANPEENPAELVNALEQAGVAVWVAMPQTVQEAVNLLWQVVGLYHDERMALKVRSLVQVLDWTRNTYNNMPKFRYFCPLWQGTGPTGEIYWVTFNRHTYTHDLLGVFGGVNIFADRCRLYPLEADIGLCAAEDPGKRDTRYARVTPAEVIQADPEVILVPDEPYSFSLEELAAFSALASETPAGGGRRLITLKGSLITWYGTHLGRALDELPLVLHQPENKDRQQ